MKVVNRGVWGYQQDDAGLVSGIWVENITLAQLDDDYKPNLRMLLSWLSIDPSTGIGSAQCEDLYEAVATNKLLVVSAEPGKGGGFWIVREDDSEKPERSDPRPWWKFW